MKTPEQKEQHECICVGGFTLKRFDETSVWIERTGGEGGQFQDAEFEAAIAEFYDQRF